MLGIRPDQITLLYFGFAICLTFVLPKSLYTVATGTKFRMTILLRAMKMEKIEKHEKIKEKEMRICLSESQLKY